MIIILTAFAQVFFFTYTQDDICDDTEVGELLRSEDECYEHFPHCHMHSSLFKVFVMM